MAIGLILETVAARKNNQDLDGATGNYRSDEFAPIFKSLTKAWKTGYAYNCGIISIVKLLRGMVGGYVNASMPVHDACHLFTLVSAPSQSPACVSDFAGLPLSWGSDERVELVAAPEKIRAEILEVIREASACATTMHPQDSKAIK